MGSTSGHGGARPGSAQRRGRERRALRVGLVLSIVVHVAAILWVSELLTPRPRSSPRATRVVVVPPSGMRAVQLSVVQPGREAAPQPEQLPRTVTTPARTQRRVPAEPGPEAEARKPDVESAADRLAPRVVDPRFYEPMVLVPHAPTLSEVEARLGAAVEMLNDSALAATDRALRSRDWTVVDKNGGKWGISPGKLHLGKLTLPLPIYLVSDDEFDPKSSRWIELQDQADRAALLDSFRERVKAIRDRRDRERAERKAAETGGGSTSSGGG